MTSGTMASEIAKAERMLQKQIEKTKDRYYDVLEMADVLIKVRSSHHLATNLFI